MPVLHDMIGELWKPGMAVRLVGVAVTGFQEEETFQESLFDSSVLIEENPHAESSNRGESASAIDAENGRRLSRATDIVKDRFGEMAVFYGRELHVNENTTGSAPKNPADYLK